MNRNSRGSLYLFAGIVGSTTILSGQTQPIAQELYYIIGAALLLATAIYFNLTFFIALELILIAGQGGVLLNIGTVPQLVLPILLCLQLLAYYFLSGQLKNIFLLIGVCGIPLLSIDFAYENQWACLFGSLAIAIFATNQVYNGRHIALLWVILYTIFMLTAIYKLVI